MNLILSMGPTRATRCGSTPKMRQHQLTLLSKLRRRRSGRRIVGRNTVKTRSVFASAMWSTQEWRVKAPRNQMYKLIARIVVQLPRTARRSPVPKQLNRLCRPRLGVHKWWMFKMKRRGRSKWVSRLQATQVLRMMGKSLPESSLAKMLIKLRRAH